MVAIPAFTVVGHLDQSEDHLWIAEYLERKADDLEQRGAKDHNEADALFRLDRVAPS